MNVTAFLGDQPAGQIVKKILDIFPTALIAGGFVRDTLLGRPYKDIDIMLEREPTDDELNAFYDAFKADCIRIYEEGGSTGYLGGDCDTRQTQLFGVWQDEDKKFDILHVSDAKLRVEDFPDNLSKCYVDVNGLFMHPEFCEGHSTKTLRYRAEAGTPRLGRLQDKFPDYALVVYATNEEIGYLADALNEEAALNRG